MTDLFGHIRPRRSPRVMMHAVDSGLSIRGKSAAHFRCTRCGRDDGWSEIPPTSTALRRGLPCPNCNGAGDAQG
ncbi:Zn-ribbon domain-containing protein [Sphingobium sp. AS12]|uniref:Zn-ribbon domain-containing protein n=1 Tax=Sphingobium sp. AS12 TaxID=2849495 RepID=UPI001C31B9B1|nr:Zn-ribbon domain-containing protein [Sphingobium sp. AS12]MBV2147915.1 Zn-ribbon domain-containing protein [Sphingobium sp. AS12]